MSKEGDESRVKLDEVLKSLFNVSKKVLIGMMNSLFHEDYDIDSTEVTFENNEFVTDDYDIIRGDLFLKISNDNKPYHYHKQRTQSMIGVNRLYLWTNVNSVLLFLLRRRMIRQWL